MDKLSEIRARWAAATHGEWDVEATSNAYTVFYTTTEPYQDSLAEVYCKADADFIAHAPADIALLLAEVERLRERLTITDENLGMALTAYREHWGHLANEPSMRAALLAAGMEEASNG